jgi:hypothetical protein
MDIGQQPGAWHDFFLATSTASAALLGLFFVAITLHLNEIEAHPILRNRARINIQALALLLAACLCVLLPGQSNQWLGSEFMVIIGVYWTLGTIGVVHTRSALGGLPRGLWLRLISQNSLTVLTVAAGVRLVARQGPGLYLEAPVVVLGLLAATLNVWNVIYGPELRKLKTEKRESSRLH